MNKWREQCKVHPAADVFPMMNDEKLAKLGEDIKANGLREAITVTFDGDDCLIVCDGRNRLEAMERAGLLGEDIRECRHKLCEGDPLAHIISKNIHRRHLTKEQQAELIIAAHTAAAKATAEKLRQDGKVSGKGGRGKVDKLKAAAVASAKGHDISKRTVERVLAKTKAKPLPLP